MQDCEGNQPAGTGSEALPPKPAPDRQDISRRAFLAALGAGAGAVGVWVDEVVAAPQLRPESAQPPDATAIKRLRTHKEKPLNAEPDITRLVRTWITPVAHFYVRNHGEVPKVAASSYRLSIEGLVERPLQLSLDELTERFLYRVVTATVTCAGNRRSEHNLTRVSDGDPWAAGAIGNAEWGGIELRELLRHAGVRPEAKHIWFEGMDPIDDKGEKRIFGASISLTHAMSAPDGVLLAVEMNGAALPPEHGSPARVIVPGAIGARSVKWLGRVIVSDRPSDNHYMTKAYKLVARDEPAAWAAAEPIQAFPLNSAIGLPLSGAQLPAGRNRIRGWALSPASTEIARIELSRDGGSTWSQTTLVGPTSPYCWRLWEAEVVLSPGEHELVLRATDTSGAAQPPRVEWNAKGYLYNAWHRVRVRVLAA